MHLIIGASGYVGFDLYTKCRAQNIDITGTYCTPSSLTYGLTKFDITKDDVRSIASGEGYAVICAANANINACKLEYNKAYEINVTATKRLISQLHDMGRHIIFCSSDNVFGGSSGGYSEDDQPSPINEYGAMKYEVERFVTENYPDVCVFRLSKVVGDTARPRDMLREWKTQALAGETIRCIRGNIFNPVDVGDVVACVELAWRHKLSGIYNVCGDRKGSRADLCRGFLSITGLSADIREEPLDAFGFADTRPLDTSMLNAKFKERTGYQFTPYEEICGRYR